MALIVQKYGGTSVANVERIRAVAERVAKFKMLGHQVVVVLSAMSGETNRLIGLAKEIQAVPDPRELDMLVSTGEQVTIALLAMALKDLGLKAKSYTGGQVKILTDNAYTKARILSIDEANMRRDLDTGHVVVVAGFLGVDRGRGKPRQYAGQHSRQHEGQAREQRGGPAAAARSSWSSRTPAARGSRTPPRASPWARR